MTKQRERNVTHDGINYKSLKTSQEIRTLTDNDLLEYICFSKDDEVAYCEFVNRFIKDCQSICEKLCARRRLDNHIGLQIASDTFEKVRRYKSYKKPVGCLDEKKAIIGFLYKIALNLFNDHYNKAKRGNEPHSTYFDTFTANTTDLTDSLLKKEITAQIFKKLNEKERTVILIDFEYKKHHKYLPDSIIEKLATELNVKPATIRKIRERAILKVQKAIDEYNEQ